MLHDVHELQLMHAYCCKQLYHQKYRLHRCVDAQVTADAFQEEYALEVYE